MDEINSIIDYNEMSKDIQQPKDVCQVVICGTIGNNIILVCAI